MSENRHPEPMLARPADTAGVGRRSADGKSSDREPALLPPGVDPDAIVDQILELLGESRWQTARKMAAEALARFPDHWRVQGAWGIFDNRGKARVGKRGPEPSTHEELQWLRDPPEWARGKWVALAGSEAIAAAETLEEVLETLKSKNLKARLLHRVGPYW